MHAVWQLIFCSNPLDSQQMDNSQSPQTRRLTPLSLSNLCAEYLRYQFQFKLNVRSSQSTGVAMVLPVLPLMLPLPLTSELDCITLTLVDTFLNRGK
jgi:hypothetical protein